MGKGDIKSKRGKIWNNSYGVRRPRKQKNPAYVQPEASDAVESKKVKKQAAIVEAPAVTEEKPKRPRKAAAPKAEAADEKPKAKKTAKKAKEEGEQQDLFTDSRE